MLRDFQAGNFISPFPSWFLIVVFCLGLPGCRSRFRKPAEVVYITAPQANLRDRVAALYNKTGVVHNGEQVVVLERSKRFLKVRDARGEEGWLEERFAVGPQVYAQFQMLAKANEATPVQAHGVTRAPLNIHISPGRDTDHLYQLKEGDRVEILKRATAEKPVSAAAVRPLRPAIKDVKEKKEEEAPAVLLEDWSLIRDAQRHVGWVLARMVDVDIPLEVAQYAEGQRIVGYTVINQVQDGGNKVNQYVVLLTEPRDGLPFDYNQVRLFTWNAKRHRYETAYRERNLFGVFPVTSGTQDFGKEGVLPTFTLRVKDNQGNAVERKYKLNGPIVRRVVGPGEDLAPLRTKRKK